MKIIEALKQVKDLERKTKDILERDSEVLRRHGL